MKIQTKCSGCATTIIVDEKELPKKLKKGIYRYKFEQIPILSFYSIYRAKKKHYGKYVICPVCKGKVWIHIPIVTHDDCDAEPI